jgi:ABC-type transporter Mla MlaB component
MTAKKGKSALGDDPLEWMKDSPSKASAVKKTITKKKEKPKAKSNPKRKVQKTAKSKSKGQSGVEGAAKAKAGAADSSTQELSSKTADEIVEPEKNQSKQQSKQQKKELKKPAESDSAAVIDQQDAMKAVSIELTHDLSVINISAVYEILLGHMQNSNDVILDASAINNIDTAGLQLLLAFYRNVSEQNRNISWNKPSRELLEIASIYHLCEEMGLPVNIIEI